MARNRITGRETQKMQEYTQGPVSYTHLDVYKRQQRIFGILRTSIS